MIKGLAAEIGRNIAAPLGKRIGTGIAAYLLASGTPQDMVDAVILALGVVGGLAIDVVSYHVLKRR